MTNSKIQNKQNNIDIHHPIDEYLQCLSYCDIHPKGIDNDCEVICMERHLKANYWWIYKLGIIWIPLKKSSYSL